MPDKIVPLWKVVREITWVAKRPFWTTQESGHFREKLNELAHMVDKHLE